jgi:hypothetical protein
LPEGFLAGGGATLKSREVEAEDEEIKRLKSVLAGVCVANELLRREDRAPGEQPPFGVLEVEAMSCAVSPSSKKPYGGPRGFAVESGALQLLCRAAS